MIAAGQPIQATVDQHPPGTTFVLGRGVHTGQTVLLRGGDVLRGQPGAVLDGDSVTEFAVRGSFKASDVVIEDLEIRNYVPPPQWAAISGVNTRGWTVRRNIIHHNTGGVRLGHGMQVLDNHIHSNAQTGVLGQGDSALIAGNAVYAQNPDSAFDRFVEAGGMKITHSRNVTVRDNHVYENVGVGIWLDLDNVDALIEDNLVENNRNQGIYFEIGYGVVIRNNETAGNGFGGAWFHRGGIVVTSSPDAEIYGNVVRGNAMGIMASQQNRGAGTLGPYLLRNLWVHDNTITMDTGPTGIAVLDVPPDSVFVGRNNRFSGNTYFLGPETRYFRWMGTSRTEAEWQAFGNDVDGVFNR